MSTKQRYHLIDGIRGFALLNMILYHAAWDLVYLFHVNWIWYRSEAGDIWQQCICWTFILLSGFCQPWGRHKLRRGLTIFICGLIITIVTMIAMPADRIIFGILTFIGSAMLIMIPLEKLLTPRNPVLGAAVSFLLFLLTKNINRGYLGFGSMHLVTLPRELYHNLLTSYLGFPGPDFASSDYFSLLPWIFLFITGYFLHRIFRQKGLMDKLKPSYSKPLECLGRHTLGIYMVHQAILYLLFTVIFTFFL